MRCAQEPFWEKRLQIYKGERQIDGSEMLPKCNPTRQNLLASQLIPVQADGGRDKAILVNSGRNWSSRPPLASPGHPGDKDSFDESFRIKQQDTTATIERGRS